MLIKRLNEKELQQALALVLEVFMQFEASDYGKEGVETFKRTGIYDKKYVASLEMYGAFLGEELAGVIATRNAGSHIALFFVKGKYHKQGIGSSLFQAVLSHSLADVITVNSSPYAKEVYRHLGFEEVSEEQTVGGVRFIPMSFKRTFNNEIIT